MKSFLFLSALILSFSSFAQTQEDIADANEVEGHVSKSKTP